jgi:hypothetical protein
VLEVLVDIQCYIYTLSVGARLPTSCRKMCIQNGLPR